MAVTTITTAAAVGDGALWTLPYASVPAPDNMGEAVRGRLAQQAAGGWLPFAVIDRLSDRAVGMTNYLHIDAPGRRLEIGGSWYRQSAQRTGINVESKLLLLGHAFEALDCIAVELRTNRLNQQSRTAIEALGAKLDGILRHQLDPSGRLRDTCVYRIVAPEWPEVKRRLEQRLQRRRNQGSRRRLPFSPSWG